MESSTEVQRLRLRKRRLGDIAVQSHGIPYHPYHENEPFQRDIRLYGSDPILIPPPHDPPIQVAVHIPTRSPTFVRTASVGTDPTLSNNDWSPSSPRENVNSYVNYMGSYVLTSTWADEWSYFSTLYCWLFLWVAYLLFPKGCRRRFCGAAPRRYAKSKWKNEFGSRWKGATMKLPSDKHILGISRDSTNMSGSCASSSSSTQDANWIGADERRRQERQLFLQELQEAREEGRNQFKDYQERHHEALRQGAAPEYQTQQPTSDLPYRSVNPFDKAGMSSLSAVNTTNDKFGSIRGNNNSTPSSYGNVWSKTPTSGGHGPPRPTSTKAPPSPEHPGISKLPPLKILNETMDRLKKRGIRLIAHGVQCDPKRVWIRLDDDTTSVAWQTEYPRRVVNQSGEASIVLMRGALHNIALPNILYVDIGKKTNALMRKENRSIPDSICFSLLTQNGSLDLQTNSKLERDALVSCFSLVLDQVHTEDWRSLYEESPAPSQTTSSNYDTATTGSFTNPQHDNMLVEI